MKFIRNRVVIGVFCLLVALALCFLVVPLVAGDKSEIQEIVLVSTDIPANTLITDAMIEVVDVGTYNLPKTIFKNKKDVIGKYALAALSAGDYILPSKIGATFNDAEAYFTKLDGKSVAISYAIPSFAAGVSSKLLAGDLVSVELVDETEPAGAYVVPELRYLRVISVSAADGAESSTENPAATVTFLVSPYQADCLAGLTGKTTHLVLAFRGDEDKAEALLQEQAQYLSAPNQEPVTEETQEGGEVDGQE